MKTTLIAIGNCGFNIANDMIEAEIIIPSDYIVCDSDVDELQNKKLGRKCRTIRLQSFEGNLNTDLIPLVSEIVPEDTNLVVICAGMGGHTGSRYAPLIAMAAQALNKKVISVYATAFNKFEGENVQMRSKWGFLQQQIASDFCVYQDNNFLKKDLMLDEMNSPLIHALKALYSARPISEWPNITTSEIKEIMVETAKEYSPVMIHNFYSKKNIDFDTRKSMFNEIIALNS